jgi:short-subunit dehydrogenase
VEIAGRRILVTGSTGGIGSRIVASLAHEGASLVLVGRRPSALAAQAARWDAETVVADLAVPSELSHVADVANGCDALVLNAGVLNADPTTVMAVNLLAPMRLATSFVAARRGAGGTAALVFTGSVAGVSPSPGMGAYNASKFGLRGFALSLAAELAGTPVSATHLVVGYVRDVGMLADSGGRPPRGVRTCSAEQVASAVVEALDRGPAERWVAPWELRLAALATASSPRLVGPVLRRIGSGARRSSGGANWATSPGVLSRARRERDGG